ncbi:MAG TPA: DUF5615 family PIN-like protein [Catalimonadaceae bacterium]|nr:DUF5615 family PIN-like protein [Catalimonadaceae bacterium]
MKFIIDTQLPPNLEELFKWKGHEARHTIRWQNGHLMNDNEIISIAKSEGFIVVTKDNDFLNHFLVSGFPPAVLMLSIGNISNPDLTRFLSNNFKSIEDAFLAGSHLVVLQTDRLIVW